MSTSSATEAARQPDGQFGPQARSELDPANAGLETPEAPLPSWDEAVAHAETLRAQGVDVSMGEKRKWKCKWILIRGTNGKYHDPADGTPAYQVFYPDGSPKVVEHYTNGELHDPDDGTPAVQWFYPDGTPKWISHWTNGYRHDPADGTPAWQGFYSGGTPERISHWTNGELHDPADGTPAYRTFYSGGTPKWIEHWTDGKLVSEERFPPPTGEA